MRYLTAPFEFLADVERVPGLIEGRLRSGVFALTGKQRIVILGHGSGEAPSRDLHLCARERLGDSSAVDANPAQGAGREILMGNGPFPVDVDAVIGDESALGQFAIALRAQVFRP